MRANESPGNEWNMDIETPAAAAAAAAAFPPPECMEDMRAAELRYASREDSDVGKQ